MDKKPSQEQGSIEGLMCIDRQVFEALTNGYVYCRATANFTDTIASASGHRVYVFGLIHYDVYSMPISIDVQEFRIL